MADEPARLRIVSFAIHSARGVIRDRSTRRRVMLVVVLVAMFMLLFGTTFLQPFLSSPDHRGWFMLFWFACAWLTLTALLLAFFDILALRAQERSARKSLRDKLERD